MTDSTELETRIEARIRGHAAWSDRPFDAALIAAAAVASAGPRRTPTIWRWPAAMSAPIVVLLVLALVVALAAAAILSGQAIRLLGDLVAPRIAPSVAPPSLVEPSPLVAPTPAPTDVPVATVAPPTITVPDPHALLVLTGRTATSARNSCTDVDRYAIDQPGSRARVIDCAGRVRIRADGSEAAVQGPKGLAFVDLRTGRTTSTLDTGKNTFAIAISPSGRYHQWETCPDYDHGPCTVLYGARDGSNRHVLGHSAIPGYIGFIEWTPDESIVSIPISATGDVLVGKGDGSDLHRRTPKDWQGTSEGSGTVTVVGWVPDGSAYLYLSRSQVVGNCVSFCVAEQVDVWEQPLDGSAATKVTDLVPGDLVVGAALSTDGTSLAFLKKHVRPGSDPHVFDQETRTAPTELWIRDATGVQRRLEVPLLPTDDGRIEPVLMRWAPDSKHLAIDVSNGQGGSKASIDMLLVPLDGSPVVVLQDARKPVWSPDGTLIAFTHQLGPDDRDGNAPDGTSFDVAASDGSGRRQVLRPGPGRDVGYVIWAAS